MIDDMGLGGGAGGVVGGGGGGLHKLSKYLFSLQPARTVRKKILSFAKPEHACSQFSPRLKIRLQPEK